MRAQREALAATEAERSTVGRSLQQSLEFLLELRVRGRAQPSSLAAPSPRRFMLLPRTTLLTATGSRCMDCSPAHPHHSYPGPHSSSRLAVLHDRRNRLLCRRCGRFHSRGRLVPTLGYRTCRYAGLYLVSARARVLVPPPFCSCRIAAAPSTRRLLLQAGSPRTAVASLQAVTACPRACPGCSPHQRADTRSPREPYSHETGELDGYRFELEVDAFLARASGRVAPGDLASCASNELRRFDMQAPHRPSMPVPACSWYSTSSAPHSILSAPAGSARERRDVFIPRVAATRPPSSVPSTDSSACARPPTRQAQVGNR